MVLRSPRMKRSLFLLPALIACSSIGHAGCLAHARRYFFQAVEAHPDDRRAIALVATIDELFAIDAQARNQNLTLSQRDGLRQQLAPPNKRAINNYLIGGLRVILPGAPPIGSGLRSGLTPCFLPYLLDNPTFFHLTPSI